MNKFLAVIPSPPQGVWHWGSIPIRAYAVCILIGIVVAVFWTNKRWIAAGGEPGDVEAVAVWAVPFGIIGGRLYHVATDWKTYFSGPLRPVDALKIWDGGLGIWGAVLLGGIGAAIACRRRGIALADFADAVAPPIILAQAIGRLGNYFNQELFGRETTLPWGLVIYDRRDHNLISYDLVNGISTGHVYKIVHPTFLYELIWNLILVFLLVWAQKKFSLHRGQVFASYVAGYSFGRFFVELMRDDSASHILGLRVNTFTSAICFLAAVVWLVISRRKDTRSTVPAAIALESGRELDVSQPERSDRGEKKSAIIGKRKDDSLEYISGRKHSGERRPRRGNIDLSAEDTTDTVPTIEDVAVEQEPYQPIDGPASGPEDQYGTSHTPAAPEIDPEAEKYNFVSEDFLKSANEPQDSPQDSFAAQPDEEPTPNTAAVSDEDAVVVTENNSLESEVSPQQDDTSAGDASAADASAGDDGKTEADDTAADTEAQTEPHTEADSEADSIAEEPDEPEPHEPREPHEEPTEPPVQAPAKDPESPPTKPKPPRVSDSKLGSLDPTIESLTDPTDEPFTDVFRAQDPKKKPEPRTAPPQYRAKPQRFPKRTQRRPKD